MSETTIPTVEGRLQRGQIVINCPYCGEQHYHGAGGGGEGHRVAHCDQQRYPESGPGYIIKLADRKRRAYGLTECEVCDFTYVAPEDNRKHALEHSKHLALSKRYAVPRFGPLLWAYAEREQNKSANRDERTMYAWFCRSVLARSDFTHPDFETYTAMMSEGGSLHASGGSYA